MDSYAQVKEGMRWMWSLGSYPELAARLEPCARELAATAGIGPGMDILDVAAGDGNLAMAAASRGAKVTACDLTLRMVELGRARSAADGLDVAWVEADAEDLPFPAASFDLVASVFGAIFAPLPERVATELFRAVRPGGVVAMANYASRGILARITELVSGLRPAPAGVELPSPYLWGDPAYVRHRFDGLAEPGSIHVRERTGTFEFSSVEEGVGFWHCTNPPQAALRSSVTDNLYRELMAGLERLFRELNRADDGRLLLEWDYVEVVARRPS